MKKNSRVFFIITTFVIGLLGTVAYILSQYTLVDFGISVAYFALLALVSGTFLWNLRLWMRITGFTNFLPNYLCHSVCTGVVGLALFYVCNYAFAADEGGHTEKSVVKEKFTKVRHKKRRVSRNRYVLGDAYYVYYVKVKFDNGLDKEFQVDCTRYRRLHEGDTLMFSVSDGCFGIPVIKYNEVFRHTSVR